jgi:hypothetical protein
MLSMYRRADASGLRSSCVTADTKFRCCRAKEQAEEATLEQEHAHGLVRVLLDDLGGLGRDGNALAL